jgi:hypothetical protein
MLVRKSSAHNIPDFARLHQANAQKVAARIQRIKASAKVTVPASPHLSTKHRAKKRAVFDAALAHKEKITIQLREERTREDAKREELETKELRRKLDEGVKANPVPAFYHERPRREVDD